MDKMKKLLLCGVIISVLALQGCLVLPIAGIIATAGAGYLKYKGNMKAAEAIEEFRADVRDELEAINKKLE